MSGQLGRPKAAKNVTTTQIVATPRCPVCGCTDRSPYRLVNCVDFAGVTSAGVSYTHVVSRRTKCSNCAKVRIDKFFESRTPAASPGDENEPLGHESVK